MATQMTGASPASFVARTQPSTATRPLTAHAFLRFPGTSSQLSNLSLPELGPQPPTAEWGAMLARGVDEIERRPFLPLVAGLGHRRR